MQTCKTCRHWERSDASTIFGRCSGIPFCEDLTERAYLDEMRSRLAANPAHPNAGWWQRQLDQQRPKEDAKAYTEDASGYRADLFCRPDFGCVYHEPDTEAVREDDGA